MNAPVNPTQLELVPDDASLGHDDNAPVNPGNIAKRIVAERLAGPAAPPRDEDFDWIADETIILREQRATAVYHNKGGDIVIRQQAAWDDEADTFVFITAEN